MIDYNDKTYDGSAIFFQGSSKVSWTVRIGGLLSPKYGYKLSKFSHVATIFWREDLQELWVIEAVKPSVSIMSLKEAVEKYGNDYCEIVRLSSKNYERVLENYPSYIAHIKKSIGRPYSNKSAVLSELDGFYFLKDGSNFNKWFNKHFVKSNATHCSQLDFEIMMKATLIGDEIDAVDATPMDCYFSRLCFR